MKFMKLGIKPDTFYTEEATRTVLSDTPSDLTIQINNICYLLHKFTLLPKCGLLRQLCSDSEDSGNITIELHEIPGGEDAFELCAKFCYGITISLSAHNFVKAFCAAKFLVMTESVQSGNFFSKLQAFFASCILEGWKDSIVTLESTATLYEWSENLGVVRRCIESIVDKILTPPTKVTWSYTYTRTGYDKRRHKSVPKDWWTEDVSFLDIDMFRYIIVAVMSTNMMSPQLIGEALHVYACRRLFDIQKSRPKENSTSKVEDHTERKQRILETIISMIPAEKGSVSTGFLLELLSLANSLGVSLGVKAELVRRCGVQLDEAMLNDLLLFRTKLSNDDESCYDVDLVKTVLESFLRQWRRQILGEESQSLIKIQKVGKLIDSYLQHVASDENTTVEKMVSLAGTVPDFARPQHDDIYKAINIYLKEHPDLEKADKKQLCRILDCQKLSREVCAHAVRNERLPLRTVVQVLYFEQERDPTTASDKASPRKQQIPLVREEISYKEGSNASLAPSTSGTTQSTLRKPHQKPQKPNHEQEREENTKRKDVLGEKLKGCEIRERVSASELESRMKGQVRKGSEPGCSKGRQKGN